jgi:ABC-type transport system involved in multi-copper enzyme maturation permease subunit
MLKTIAWKEFRELLPIIITAFALQFFVICSIVGISRKYQTLPQDLHGAAVLLMFESGLLAIALGLWQNMAEQNQGTFLFLFHRPWRRESIVAAKLLIGASVCLLVGSLPIAGFALWADARMEHATALRDDIWSAAWPVSFCLLLLYLGAFMSSFRAATWYKSRYLPLFCGLALFALLAALAHSRELTVLVATPLVSFCFVVGILYEAMTRDFS